MVFAFYMDRFTLYMNMFNEGIHLTSVYTICRLSDSGRLPQNYYGI